MKKNPEKGKEAQKEIPRMKDIGNSHNQTLVIETPNRLISNTESQTNSPTYNMYEVLAIPTQTMEEKQTPEQRNIPTILPEHDPIVINNFTSKDEINKTNEEKD